MSPTICLLQIRDLRSVEEQERQCFVDCSGVPRDRFRFHNLVERPAIEPADVAGAEVVIIGGAGSHSVTETYPFTAPLAALVRELVAAERPLFGSCWGHQFIAEALGGRVVTDPERSEVGTFDLEVTEAGARDPLFAGLPRRFPAQFGHHDRVVELPVGAVELARTERCANQAFRLAGTPVWGAQFHVELDPARMVERASVYREGYLPDENGLARLSRSLRPSPEAGSLLRRFLATLGACE